MQTGKNRRITFRPPSKTELKSIRQGLAKYLQPKHVKTLLENRHLLIGRGHRKEVYLVSAGLWKIYQTIQPHYHPYFIGLFLGDLQAEVLIPSLHVLPHLVSHGKEDAVIQVTAEGEQHFLYGHNLDHTHVHPLSGRTKEGDIMIVVNSSGEGLGYGNLRREEKHHVKLTNQNDLGWYLRRGK